MPINVPIILTWLRIAMIPLVVGLFYLPSSWMAEPARDTLAAWAFIIAALTDWFDGWLARRWNQTSAFGAFLDPVADKLMVCAALIASVMAQTPRLLWRWPPTRSGTSIALVIESHLDGALRAGRRSQLG